MNYRMILYITGWIFKILAAALLLPTIIGLYYHEAQWKFYIITALASFAVGFLLSLKKPKKNVFYSKEGFVTVALCWVILSVVGAVPFYVSGEIPFYVDAVFEMASGFTTTGASILTDVEALSHAALFWRSFSHWLGGMGVLVFLIALLPMAGGHIMQLMKAESPGPSVGKFVPKIRQTALILYAIYFALTVLQVLLLLAGGMPWFDSITTAMGTAGTGGFGVRNSSMAYYNSNYLQAVVTVFMIIFGVNFNVYYLLILRKFKDALKSEELRWYLGIISFSVICITLDTFKSCYGGHLYNAFHDSAFSVASVISTTGFSTTDFDTWPQFSKFILFVLMFVGACAGSTGGGIKVSRLIILLKSAFYEIANIVHPRGVNIVKLDKKRVDKSVIASTTSFFIISLFVYVISVFIISLDGFDMVTSTTAVAATMNNIGPGLSLVGPSGNYSMFSPLSKIVMIFDMLAGRLEYFPMMVLLSPAVWKGGFATIKRRILWKKRNMSLKKSP
ncbi:MAG: TrkH family potassium uptake protein [Acutalibacteraceae bacterium]